ncbi:Diacylglycerol kinase [Roseovarius albus]|uniref:Diacylglycerol kinase n=1 Tax=Roseovarius albus TaxID=1247867 RepID=A0A1X6YK02_9RHOB|nr:diacylglycerol kinase [Roseovarius albus]SLN21913.1 Diacylglycerol kinase [Roseovarius albus]
MGNQPLKGFARLRAAYANSMTGFRDIWRGEEAFRIEFIAFVLSVPAAFWVGQNAIMIALLIISVLLLVIVEILNSAVEAAIDRIGPERHELSRQAKDYGSLAVLLATLIPGILWIAALYTKFCS